MHGLIFDIAPLLRWLGSSSHYAQETIKIRLRLLHRSVGMKPPAHPVLSLSPSFSAPLTDDANTIADCKSEARRYIACSVRTDNQGVRNFWHGCDCDSKGRNKGRRMTPGHVVESEAACEMCALTLPAPVRGTEMGVAAAGAGGCVCVPRHELIMQPTTGPLITLGSVFQVLFGSIWGRGYVDGRLYCSRSCVAHAQ